MDEHAARRMLEGGGGWPGRLCRSALWLPGKLYGGLMRLRRAGYEAGLFRSVHLPVPTLSVGNLTAGGSGKTPLVVMLCREIAAMGKRPGVLLRGYGESPEGISDEAVMYGNILPGLIVETGADRRLSARRALARGAGVLVLDDGFQHLKVVRDLDIVLVDATSPWGGGNTLPGGLLREPRTALNRAAAVIVTRSDQRDAAGVEALRREIARLAPAARVFTARHRVARLRRLDGADLPLGELRNRRVVALCGIARPEAFRATLAGMGAEVVELLAAPDHAPLDRGFLENAMAVAGSRDAVVITTEKDRGKKIFADLAAEGSQTADEKYGWGRLWTLGIEQEVDEKERLVDLVRETVGGRKESPSGNSANSCLHFG